MCLMCANEQTDDIVDERNPAPVDRSFIPLFTMFYTSLVVQDFFQLKFQHMVGNMAN